MSALESLPQVHLKPRRALPFFSHHPWVFAGAIRRVEGAPAPGDEVVLRADDGKFVARGLFNPDSNIRVRLYSWNPDVAIDETLFSERLDQAIALRNKLFSTSSGARACRLVYSEGDSLSGLTIDQYGDHLLVQWTSRALAARQDMILELLNQKVQPAGIWVRTERGIGELEGLELVDGLAAGTAPPVPCSSKMGDCTTASMSSRVRKRGSTSTRGTIASPPPDMRRGGTFWTSVATREASALRLPNWGEPNPCWGSTHPSRLSNWRGVTPN